MKARFIAVGCLALMACFYHNDQDGDSRSPDTVHAQPPPPAAQGDFCQRWAQAACSDAVVSACQASDVDACRQTQTEFCHMLAPSDIAKTAGAQCISAVAAAYRDADLSADELALVLRFAGPCDRLITGSAGPGDSCSDSSDCDRTRGYDCVKKADSNTGTCEIPQIVDPGRDCRAAAKTCSDGFYCDGHDCIEVLSKGDPCTIHEQCGDSGYCDESGHCAAQLAVNEPCQSDIECAHGICDAFEGDKVCTDHVVLSRADPICANLR